MLFRCSEKRQLTSHRVNLNTNTEFQCHIKFWTNLKVHWHHGIPVTKEMYLHLCSNNNCNKIKLPHAHNLISLISLQTYPCWSHLLINPQVSPVHSIDPHEKTVLCLITLQTGTNWAEKHTHKTELQYVTPTCCHRKKGAALTPSTSIFSAMNLSLKTKMLRYDLPLLKPSPYTFRPPNRLHSPRIFPQVAPDLSR